MRIRVDDQRLRDELAAALARAGCETRTIGRTLDVTHVDAPDDQRELRFFLRAWHGRHPHARLKLIG